MMSPEYFTGCGKKKKKKKKRGRLEGSPALGCGADRCAPKSLLISTMFTITVDSVSVAIDRWSRGKQSWVGGYDETDKHSRH